MKSHTNQHTVRSWPTLKDVKRFRNGSVCKPYEGSIYERTFWVNLWRIVLYQSSYQPGLLLFNLMESIFRNVIVFLDVIVNQAESQHEFKNVIATRAERLENLFTNVSVRVHLSKTLWETSLSIIKNLELNDIFSLFPCNRVMCLYKNETNAANYCYRLKKLMYVDPSKTILGLHCHAILTQ